MRMVLNEIKQETANIGSSNSPVLKNQTGIKHVDVFYMRFNQGYQLTPQRLLHHKVHDSRWFRIL